MLKARRMMGTLSMMHVMGNAYRQAKRLQAAVTTHANFPLYTMRLRRTSPAVARPPTAVKAGEKRVAIDMEKKKLLKGSLHGMSTDQSQSQR